VDRALRQRVRAALRGRVAEDVPLAPLCTYRVGGPAALLAEPEDADDLAALLRLARDEGLATLVVGGGSNLLVADAGFDGVAVRLTASPFRVLERLEPGPDGPRLAAGGGVRLGRLVTLAVRRGWPGLVPLEGIPGTLGGAVRMNAGTPEGDVASVLVEAEVVTADDGVARWPAAACGLTYRSSALPPGAVVSGVVLAPGEGDPAEAGARRRALRERRREKQPAGRTAGSVFRNPPGDFAGRLLDAADLKGTVVGGARVSEVHANFIVTEDGATAADVRALLNRCAEEVERRFGVRLEPENVIVGFS